MREKVGNQQEMFLSAWVPGWPMSRRCLGAGDALEEKVDAGVFEGRYGEAVDHTMVPDSLQAYLPRG